MPDCRRRRIEWAVEGTADDRTQMARSRRRLLSADRIRPGWRVPGKGADKAVESARVAGVYEASAEAMDAMQAQLHRKPSMWRRSPERLKNKTPDEIVAWVGEHIALTPYRGVLKGPSGHARGPARQQSRSGAADRRASQRPAASTCGSPGRRWTPLPPRRCLPPPMAFRRRRQRPPAMRPSSRTLPIRGSTVRRCAPAPSAKGRRGRPGRQGRGRHRGDLDAPADGCGLGVGGAGRRYAARGDRRSLVGAGGRTRRHLRDLDPSAALIGAPGAVENFAVDALPTICAARSRSGSWREFNREGVLGRGPCSPRTSTRRRFPAASWCCATRRWTLKSFDALFARRAASTPRSSARSRRVPPGCRCSRRAAMSAPTGSSPPTATSPRRRRPIWPARRRQRHGRTGRRDRRSRRGPRRRWDRSLRREHGSGEVHGEFIRNRNLGAGRSASHRAADALRSHRPGGARGATGPPPSTMRIASRAASPCRMSRSS